MSLKNTIWLFPGRPKKIDNYVTIRFSDYNLKKIRTALDFYFTPHYFRHTLITNLKKKECPQDCREGLLNHAPKTTQGRFYEHLDIPEKRAIYDKYFPYYSIKYF
jgi:integrase